MIRRITIVLSGMIALLVGGAIEYPHDSSDTRPAQAAIRFAWVDAYIDPQGKPLAAYQFELTARGADVTLIGIEGGEHPAFIQPPYYDPRANLQNRIVIAAFNTGDDLPKTRTRVARIMVRIRGGKPAFSARLDVAGSTDAKPITASVTVSEGASL